MRISDWSSDVCSSDLQRGDRLDLLGVCAEAARVSDEIDLGQHLVTRVGEQIVEGGAAGRGLKAVNATEATIVEQHEDQFDAHRNRGGQLRIEHQIAAVANHDIDMARGLGELDANTAGDLIRSEEHTSELQSLMRISYAVYGLKKKTKRHHYR